MALLLRFAFPLLALASASALVAAYTAQYGFGLQPCELCLFQRPAFYAVVLLGIFGWFLKNTKARLAVLALIGMIMLGNSGLALFHTGVEQHWWPGLAECSSGEIETGLSLEELRAQILSAPLVRCDEPAWQFHGITMAAMNVVFCFALAMVAFYAFTQTRRQA